MSTRRCAVVALAVLAGWLAVPAAAEASHFVHGYRYSATYAPGYRHYSGGYYGTPYYFPAGYYYDHVNVVNVINVAAFVPYFVPSAVFTTYQAPPAVPLTAIAPVAAVPAPVDPCAKHIAAFEARIAEMEKRLKAAEPSR